MFKQTLPLLRKAWLGHTFFFFKSFNSLMSAFPYFPLTASKANPSSDSRSTVVCWSTEVTERLLALKRKRKNSVGEKTRGGNDWQPGLRSSKRPPISSCSSNDDNWLWGAQNGRGNRSNFTNCCSVRREDKKNKCVSVCLKVFCLTAYNYPAIHKY